MGLKTCEKCGEDVDEAKAFCPECGNPFVEEKKRESSSEFDKYAGTVNFSKSVYQMMLSEMELDTSKQTDKKDEPVPKKDPKTIQPVEVSTPKSNPPEVSTQRNVPVNKKPPEINPMSQNKTSGKNYWIISGVVGLVFLIILAMALLLILLYSYYF